MQYLILCHPGDMTAARVYTRMCKRIGRESVRLITAEELTFAGCIEHRVGECEPTGTRAGQGMNKLEGAGAYTRLQLHDGSVLDTRLVRGVLNRLMYAPSPCFVDQASANSRYAAMELHALLMSILEACNHGSSETLNGRPQLGKAKIIGRVSGTGLRGREAPLPVWLGMAARSGLRVRGYDFVSSPRVGSRLGWIPREPVQMLQQAEHGASSDGYMDVPIDHAMMMGKPTTYFEPCEPYQSDSAHMITEQSQQSLNGCSALAICGQVLSSELDEQERTACTRLVTTMQCDLVELRFCVTQSPSGETGLAFCGANLLPDVSNPAHLTFLVEQLIGDKVDQVSSSGAVTQAHKPTIKGDGPPLSPNKQRASATQRSPSTSRKQPTPLEVP